MAVHDRHEHLPSTSRSRSRTPFLAERRWSGRPPADGDRTSSAVSRSADGRRRRPGGSARSEGERRSRLHRHHAELLPARQRAVLLLRDVLVWSAREVAEALDCSVASANSALQRARGTLRARRADGASGSYVLSVDDITQTRLLARFSDAWERCDFDALASLLLEDAILAMPPASVTQPGSPHAAPLSLHGRAAIIDFFSTVPEGGHLDPESASCPSGRIASSRSRRTSSRPTRAAGRTTARWCSRSPTGGSCHRRVRRLDLERAPSGFRRGSRPARRAEGTWRTTRCSPSGSGRRSRVRRRSTRSR